MAYERSNSELTLPTFSAFVREMTSAQPSSPRFGRVTHQQNTNLTTRDEGLTIPKNAGEICGISIGDVTAAAHLAVLYNRAVCINLVDTSATPGNNHVRRLSCSESVGSVGSAEARMESEYSSNHNLRRETIQNVSLVESNLNSSEETEQITGLKSYQPCNNLGESSERSLNMAMDRRKKVRISCLTSVNKYPVAIRLISPVCCSSCSVARKRKPEEDIIVIEDEDVDN